MCVSLNAHPKTNFYYEMLKIKWKSHFWSILTFYLKTIIKLFIEIIRSRANNYLLHVHDIHLLL
jgi:hypothetical protein